MLVFIIGPSGQGKSTSALPNPALGIKGLDPAHCIYINVWKDELPMKGFAKTYSLANKNYLYSSNASSIIATIKKAETLGHIKYGVIDDIQRIFSKATYEGVNEKGYEKFVRMSADYANILETARSSKLIWFVLSHVDETKDGSTEVKTSGKMTRNQYTPEGAANIVLHTMVSMDDNDKPVYKFLTNTDGSHMAKSPYGMFEEQLIPNDLGYVYESIIKYYYES